MLRFLFDLLNVVKTLEPIPTFQPLFHVQNFGHEFVVLFARFDLELWRSFLDGTKCFDDQHGMMRDSCPPAFTYNCRMRHPFRIAHVHDVPDHIIGVFLERIVGGAVEIAARPIVINAEPAADVEITKFMPKLRQFCVIARPFAHGALDRRDIGHLRADVEMNKFKAMRQPGIL